MKAAATFALLLVFAGAIFLAQPSYSYLPNFTAQQPDRWDFSSFPVVWNLNPSIGSNVTGSRSVADIMQTAFNTWAAAPNAALQFSRGSDVSVSEESSSPSNTNLICFVCSDADFSKDSQTLALTITTTADRAGQGNGHGGTSNFAGQIIKADILFNPSSQYTTGGTGGQDLLTVAVHEVGHFFGLNHSGVVRSVMFPAASSVSQLGWDDVAGLASLYPKSSPDLPTGAISGTVRFAGGGAVFGAHVFAESTTGNQGFGGVIRKTPISAVTRPDGSYTITGLPPDSYVITAEPLDDPVSDSNLGSYSKVFGQPSVQTNFTTRWH